MSDDSDSSAAFADALLQCLIADADDATHVPDALSSGDDEQSQPSGTLLELFSQSATDDNDEEQAKPALTAGKRLLSRRDPSDAVSKQPKRRNKKRRYQEVLSLREVAVALERELLSLTNRQQRAETSLEAAAAHGDSGVLKWQKEATREIQAGARARLENAKLRQNVAAQTALSMALRQEMARRQSSIEELRLYLPRVYGLMIVRPPDSRESAIYDQLMHNVCARSMCDTTEVLRSNGLVELHSLVMTQQEATVSEARVLVNEQQALCIDLIDRHVIPFDFQAGARVLWANVLSKQLKVTEKVTQTNILVSTDDLLVTKLSANSNFMIEDHQFTTEYSISKRFCYANCVDFLWESITESKGALATLPHGTPAIQLAQTGWGKISRLNTRNGSSAASLESYIRLTPSAVGACTSTLSGGYEDDLSQQFDVRMLSSHIVSAFRQHSAKVRCFVENTLVDDMLNTSKPVQ